MIGNNVRDRCLSVDSLAQPPLLLYELSTSFEMIADSPRGEFSCVMAQDLRLVNPFYFFVPQQKEAHAKFSITTSVGKNVNFNQVRGCATLLLFYVVSHYALLTKRKGMVQTITTLFRCQEHVQIVQCGLAHTIIFTCATLKRCD